MSAPTRVMLWERELGTYFRDSFQSPCDMPVFGETFCLGDNICLRNMLHRLSLSECVDREAGTKLNYFPMPHRVHCSCKLSSPHILMPQSASCAPDCVMSLQYASYADRTHLGVCPHLTSPQHFP